MEQARPATDGDADEILRLASLVRSEVHEQRGGARWLTLVPSPSLDVESIRGAIADAGTLVLVGTLESVVVAYAAAHVDDTRVAVIDELYVEEPARSVGVAEALMDQILAWAAEQGCVGVESFALPGNREMKNLFERYGMTARAILVHRALPDGS